MASEDAVRTASNQFYAALNSMANGDASPMAGIWSHDASATAMHPIGGRDSGWEAIGATFEQVAQIASEGAIELKDQRIHVAGDMAYEVGVEQGQFKIAGELVSLEHRVTNVYLQGAGAWKVVHHHTDISPAMLEVLGRLQAADGSAG